MATTEEAADALVDAIADMAPRVRGTSGLLELAEALAWVRQPGQSHGSSSQG